MVPVIFLKGLIMGFAMAVPIGPAGILCIRKALAEGHGRSLMIGLGTATADSLYAGIAAFGLTFISEMIASQRTWLRLAGGGIFLALGIHTIRGKRRDAGIAFDNRGWIRSYLGAFLVALTNPMTIVAFVALFAVFGLGHTLIFTSASVLVLGVFTGSFLWFLLLGYIATHFRKQLDAGGLIRVNRIAGVLILISGIAAFASLL